MRKVFLWRPQERFLHADGTAPRAPCSIGRAILACLVRVECYVA